MNTLDFNLMRSSEWIGELNKLDSRIFLIMGNQKNGRIQIFCDDTMSPKKVAKHLRDYADHLDKGNYLHKSQKN